MKTVLFNLAFIAVRTFVSAYISRGFFNRVQVLVMGQLLSDKPGAEKAQAVRDAIAAEWEEVSTVVINLALEAVVAKFSLDV